MLQWMHGLIETVIGIEMSFRLWGANFLFKSPNLWCDNWCNWWIWRLYLLWFTLLSLFGAKMFCKSMATWLSELINRFFNFWLGWLEMTDHVIFGSSTDFWPDRGSSSLHTLHSIPNCKPTWETDLAES